MFYKTPLGATTALWEVLRKAIVLVKRRWYRGFSVYKNVFEKGLDLRCDRHPNLTCATTLPLYGKGHN